MENSYYSKYLKYKNKYLSLKSEQMAGSGVDEGPAEIVPKENGEVIKGIDGNFYAPLIKNDNFLRQIAGPNSIGVRPNLSDPKQNGKVVIKLCKTGVTDPLVTYKNDKVAPDYYKYLEGKFTYVDNSEKELETLEKKFKEKIEKNEATEDDLALVKDIIAKQNNEDFSTEDDKAGREAADEFNNVLEYCAKNRQVQDL